MFTIATNGYEPFVLNLHASLERIGLGDRLVIHSLDPDVHESLSSLGLRSALSEGAPAPGWSEWGTPGFAKAMSFKYSVALETLRSGRNALYVDSDIVFLRDPMDYLGNVLLESTADLVFQFESPKNVLCAGFWLATPSAPAVELFSQLLSCLDRPDAYVDDQETMNGMLRREARYKVHALDPELFACGNQFLDGISVERGGFHISRRDRPFPMESAYILHFNYLMGQREKAVAMVRHGVAFHPSMARIARLGKWQRATRLLRRLLRGSPE